MQKRGPCSFFCPETATRSERKRKGWQRDIKRGYQRWIVWTDTCFVQYIKIIQNHQILAINFSYVLLVHDPWLGGHDFMATSFTGSGKSGPPSQPRWWNVRGILALLGFQSFLETDRCRFCRSCSFLLSRFACVIVKLSECKLKPQIVCFHIITILSFGFSSINMCLQQIETNAIPIQSYLQIALRRIYVSIGFIAWVTGFFVEFASCF